MLPADQAPTLEAVNGLDLIVQQRFSVADGQRV
jgi:hypothetical protein